RTTIVIAHRLSTIQNADHIYVLDKGSVIEEGTHETLMSKEDGRYKTMLKTQEMTRITDQDQDDLMNIGTAIATDGKQLSQRADASKIDIGSVADQFVCFTITGSKLVRRIRSQAFACLLRQEVAYFDRSENSSGAIYARLASNATALQDMIGTRLGAICEALALSGFGLLFGFTFSWQLTLISVLLFSIQLTVSGICIHLSAQLKEKCDQYSSRANSVGPSLFEPF
ncbi:unnamed protein product, partial [Adineta ricciae]